MRRLLYGDVIRAACVLRRVEPVDRERELSRLFHRAHTADKYRKRFRKPLSGFGDGSVQSACSGLPAAKQEFLGHTEFARCLELVFKGILRWREEQSRRAGGDFTSRHERR